jgi:hypothetical protein
MTMSDTKTTIWKGTGDGPPILIGHFEGLPDPIPRVGFRLELEKFGDGVCIGYEYDGKGPDAPIVEVKLLIAATPSGARKWRF